LRRLIGWLLFAAATVAAVVFCSLWIWSIIRGKSDTILSRWASIAAIISVPVAVTTLFVTLIMSRPAKKPAHPPDTVEADKARNISDAKKYIEVQAGGVFIESEKSPVLTQSTDARAKVNTQSGMPPAGPTLRARRVTIKGESQEIEIFDLELADKWIAKDPWIFGSLTEPVDE
jgi:hypothetical protein